jgi:hypothetical protein
VRAWFGLCALALALAAACSTAATPIVGVTPIAGVIVRADSLVSGLGCGHGIGQVFKYGVLVTDADGNDVAFGVYDCFADAFFQGLNASPVTQRLDFSVRIAAMNEAEWNAQADRVLAGGSSPSAFATIVPTWTTACTATQQSNIQVPAVCAPLALASSAAGTLSLSLTALTQSDGGALACGTAFVTAQVTVEGPGAGTVTATDAGATDAGAAADAGATDGGIPVRTVRCSDGLSLGGLGAGAYALDVELFDASGRPVARTHCTAAVAPGISAVARCGPVQAP